MLTVEYIVLDVEVK